MTFEPLSRPPARQSDAREFFGVVWRLVVVGLVILSPVLLVRGCLALVADAYRTRPPNPEKCTEAGSGFVCASFVVRAGDPPSSGVRVRGVDLAVTEDVRLQWTYRNEATNAGEAMVRTDFGGQLENEPQTSGSAILAVTFSGHDKYGASFTATVPVNAPS